MDIHSEIVRLVRSALYAAAEASDCVYRARGKTGDASVRLESGSVDIALRGLSAIHAAKVLYLTNGEKDDTLDKFFPQYEIFVREITKNFVDDHSHQYTHGEKDKLFALVEATEFYVPSPYNEDK